MSFLRLILFSFGLLCELLISISYDVLGKWDIDIYSNFPVPGLYNWKMICSDDKQGNMWLLGTQTTEAETRLRHWNNNQPLWIMPQTSTTEEVFSTSQQSSFFANKFIYYVNLNGKIDRYDTNKRELIPGFIGPSSEHVRYDPCVVSIGSFMFVIGGKNIQQISQDTTLRYTYVAGTNVWVPILLSTPMIRARDSCGCTTTFNAVNNDINSWIIVAGGLESTPTNSNRIKSVERFNLFNKQWEPLSQPLEYDPEYETTLVRLVAIQGINIRVFILEIYGNIYCTYI